jgi:DNA-binding winged helix-turn-helix (wHTH) protein
MEVSQTSYTTANADASLFARDVQSHIRFGSFKLFPRRRRLIHDDEEVRIGSRAFDLLAVLAMHAGEILSHAELIRAAWPKRVVADGNLKTQIAGIQKILGRTSCGDRHIKCVALRGYVFVADVHLVQTDLGMPDATDDWMRPSSPSSGP